MSQAADKVSTELLAEARESVTRMSQMLGAVTDELQRALAQNEIFKARIRILETKLEQRRVLRLVR